MTVETDISPTCCMFVGITCSFVMDTCYTTRFFLQFSTLKLNLFSALVLIGGWLSRVLNAVARQHGCSYQHLYIYRSWHRRSFVSPYFLPLVQPKKKSDKLERFPFVFLISAHSESKR